MKQDTQEFDSIYRTYALQIYRYLLSIGCPAQDAEDVVQETFVKALLRIDSFRGDCSLLVWLCRIGKNTWLDHLRKSKREITRTQLRTAASDTQLCEWLDLVDRLEEPYRTVFLNVALGGCAYEDLAKRYGKSTSWARVTYYRARMKLQEMLSGGRK